MSTGTQPKHRPRPGSAGVLSSKFLAVVLARFSIHTGPSGVIQLKHPWQAVVKYAVGSGPLKLTTLGWGEQFSVPPNQDVLLRVVTISAVDVTIDWW